MRRTFCVGLALLSLVALTGCSEPPVPPEVHLANLQEQDLWRAGANLYAPREYQEYLAALQADREQLRVEQAKLAWFRDYAGLAARFQQLLGQGEQVQATLRQNQRRQGEELLRRATQVTERLLVLRDLAAAVKDSRLNTRGLTRVDILLAEAASYTAAGNPEAARTRLAEAELLLDQSIAAIRPIIASYIDKAQIARWKGLVDAVVAESRQRGGQAIVVNKLRRQLTLYRGGVATTTYPVGLGFNALGDKLYAGDRATPEGRYQVVRKLPQSKYYRALLLNYPNAEDQRRFAEAKRQRLIPAGAKIGGLIEIHGGGKEVATLGCIGLEDEQMLDLFKRVEVGTPVVIVGALSNDNLIRMALGRLE